MTQTIAPTVTARRGGAHVNAALDEIVGEVSWLTTDQLAGLIAVDGVIGQADTADAGPVGLWVVGELQRRGIGATSYVWVTGLTIYDSGRFVIGEIAVPNPSTLYDLECEVNDGDRGELVWQGEGDPR